MTVYTISEVLSIPRKVEQPDKFYNPNVTPPGDMELLRRFEFFASVPMEGTSCALIWWLLHASGVNGDSCQNCHNVALSLNSSSLLKLTGTGPLKRKKAFVVGNGMEQYWVREKSLRVKSIAAQKAAASTLLEYSNGCLMQNVTTDELKRCYIEQSEPLKAFAVALIIWMGDQGRKTGWLRPFLFGQFAARQPRHRCHEKSGKGYSLRAGEGMKTTVLRPGLEYNRGFQWLAAETPSHDGRFWTVPVGVYSKGHVMRIYTSTDFSKRVFIPRNEIENGIFAGLDWRAFENWQGFKARTGYYKSVGFPGNPCCCETIVYDRPVNFRGIILAGYHRHDDVWFSPGWRKVRMVQVDGVFRIKRFFGRDDTAEVTEDSLFG